MNRKIGCYNIEENTIFEDMKQRNILDLLKDTTYMYSYFCLYGFFEQLSGYNVSAFTIEQKKEVLESLECEGGYNIVTYKDQLAIIGFNR